MAGIKEFPAVPISYFDVQDEKYVTLASPPIPIEVEKADKLAGRDIVASPNGLSAGRKELEMRQEGIFANITDLGQLTDESIRPERWLAALGGLAGFYVALWPLSWFDCESLNGDTARQRRRSAPGKARRLVAEAMKDLSAGRCARRRGSVGIGAGQSCGRLDQYARRRHDTGRGLPPIGIAWASTAKY